MRTPRTEIVDANLYERSRRDSRRDSIGWLGVFVSLAIAVAGQLSKLPVGVAAVTSGVLLAVSVVLINWTRLWLKESREPFQYTFAVEEFEPRSSHPATQGETDEILSWFARDLVTSLSDRVPRLSLLQSPGDDIEGPDRAASHLHVSGWYGIRRSAEDERRGPSQRWQLEVVPCVRLGDASAPARLGQVVRYDIGQGVEGPPTVTRDQYRAAFERVYWSVASKIYSEIAGGVESKVALLPPGRLRAAAYLYEADDYATSNTLDAYAEALSFYRKARELYDVGSRPMPATAVRLRLRRLRVGVDRVGRWLRRRLAKVVRAAGRREVLTARAEIGQARMMTAEWHLKQLSGTVPSEIFDAIPLSEGAIARLGELPEDVPEWRATIFRGQLTLASARFFLRDEAGADECLQEARRWNPIDVGADAEFLFISGMNEPARRRSLRLLRQAVELDPTMERAHFHRALRFDAVWRSRPTFEPDVAKMADDEYSAVVAIDPGNLAAWANRGYIAWLLAEGEAGAIWRDRAFSALEAGRQYKEVRREAIVSELDWNLARLAAESGEFSKAYERYIEAVSAQLGDTSFEFMDYFYENAGEALQDRFTRYRKEVFRHAKGTPASERRLVDSVKAFVLNDCGLTYQHYHARSGDEKALQRASSAFEDAIKTNEAFVLPAFNLARLHRRIWETKPAGEEAEAVRHLRRASELTEEVLRREPEWTPAQLLMVDLKAQLGGHLVAARKRLEAGGETALPMPPVADLADSEELGPEEARRAQIAELEHQRIECDREIERQLRRMLPHACFSKVGDDLGVDEDLGSAEDRIGWRIDARGKQVGALLREGGIEWREQFSELHVTALIEWAKALAANHESAQPALELCEHLRRDFYRADEGVLLAQRAAARALRDETPSDDPKAKRLTDAIDECEQLLKDGIHRILADDPGHHSVLSSPTFEWFATEEQRRVLFNALEANPSPATELAVGERLVEMQLPGRAYAVFESAASRGGKSVAPVASLRRGDLDVEMDRPDAAIEAYRSAALSGNALVAPDAALRAADILAEGEANRVRELYETVARSDPEVAVELGRLLERDPGAREMAAIVYRIALDESPDDPRVAPAALGLANLLSLAGEDAVEALRIAVTAADEETRATAQIRLAQALLPKADLDLAEVEELLGGALDSSSTMARGQAAFLLARVSQDKGDSGKAERLLRRVIEEGDPGTSAIAALELEEILVAVEPEKARAVLRQAAGVSAWTALSLARTLRERGDVDGAVELSRIGADPNGAEPLFAPDAALLLGELLLSSDDLEGAEKPLWQAIGSEDLTVGPNAILELATLYEKRGNPTANAYKDAIASVEFPQALSVANSLGPRLIEEGDRESALVIYRAAAGRHPWAALQIGDLLKDIGEIDAAREAYQLANAPHSPFQAEAIQSLEALGQGG